MANEMLNRKDARLIAEEMLKLRRYEEPYIDRKEAAQYLCVSVAAIDQNKSIPRYKMGRSVRFKKSDLDRWVMSQN